MKCRKKQDIGAIIFYIAIVAIPLLNFIVLKFYVSYIDVFTFVFKKYDVTTGTYQFTSDVFYNFRNFFNLLSKEPAWKDALWVTFKNYIVGWLTTPISMLIPFYVAKKYPGGKVFKFILMMPGMIASMVWSLIYINFCDRALVSLFDLTEGLISNPKTQWAATWFKGFWLGNATSLLLYSGIFSGVSESLVDAGKVDGLGPIGEFFYIYMPALYPTWSVGIYTGLAGLFSNYAGVFEMYGYEAGKPVATVGYLLFVQVMRGGTDGIGINCAGSIFFTLACFPIVLGGKKLMEKIGPSED